MRLTATTLALALGLSAGGLATGGLAGCGAGQTATTLTYGESARRDYERALSAFQDHDCLTAEPLFQHVRREYPYSRYAALAELRAADCALEQSQYAEAIRQYRSFIRARPTHPDLHYAEFRVAVAYYRQIPQDFFLSPPREERDQGPTRSALRVLERFLRTYGDSEHAEEARTMRVEVLQLLARHELFVADFYLFRDRPRATISRIEGMLETYEGSGLEPQALVLLGRTYLHMQQPDDARSAFERVVRDYAESGFAAQAEGYLARMQRGEFVDDAVVARPDDATDPSEDVSDDAVPESTEDASTEDESNEDESTEDESIDDTTSGT